jgi:hypothetical protein
VAELEDDDEDEEAPAALPATARGLGMEVVGRAIGAVTGVSVARTTLLLVPEVATLADADDAGELEVDAPIALCLFELFLVEVKNEASSSLLPQRSDADRTLDCGNTLDATELLDEVLGSGGGGETIEELEVDGFVEGVEVIDDEFDNGPVTTFGARVRVSPTSDKPSGSAT